MRSAVRNLILFGGGGQTPLQRYEAAITALNPVLWYKFNETSGTTVINYGSLGATGNGVWTPGVGALGQTGRLGANHAYSFDALDSMVRVTYDASFGALTDFTVMALVKAATTGEGTNAAIYSMSFGLQTLRLNAGKLRAACDYNTVDALGDVTANFPLTTWNLPTQAHFGSTTKKSIVYQPAPGATVAAEALSTDTAGSTTFVPGGVGVDLFIGNREGQTRTFDGLVDEFYWFPSTLTLAQIQNIVTLSNLV